MLYLVLGEASIEHARETPGLVELARSTARRRRAGAQRRAAGRARAALTDAGKADRIGLLDAANGQAQLLFTEPAPPPEVLDLLAEYIALRQPTALFRAQPGTPVLLL